MTGRFRDGCALPPLEKQKKKCYVLKLEFIHQMKCNKKKKKRKWKSITTSIGNKRGIYVCFQPFLIQRYRSKAYCQSIYIYLYDNRKQKLTSNLYFWNCIIIAKRTKQDGKLKIKIIALGYENCKLLFSIIQVSVMAKRGLPPPTFVHRGLGERAKLSQCFATFAPCAHKVG